MQFYTNFLPDKHKLTSVPTFLHRSAATAKKKERLHIQKLVFTILQLLPVQ